MLSRLLSLLIRLTIAAVLVGAYFSTAFTSAHAQTVPPAGATAPAAMPPFTPPTSTRFEHLSLEDGLSQNAVLDLLQDRDGFLQVTQDGLNRYDGYGFTIFKNDPDDPNTLSYKLDPPIDQDSSGAIWAGTWGGGLNRIDPQSGKITRYIHNAADPTSLGNNTVSALVGGSSRFTLGRYDGRWAQPAGSRQRALHALPARRGQFKSIASDFVSTIYEDAEGKLWLGTGGFGTEGAGVDRFDPLNETFSHYRHDPVDPNTLSSDTISTVFPDESGKLWVGTGGFSLVGRGLQPARSRDRASNAGPHA